MSGPSKLEQHKNLDLFRPRLDSFINPGHALVQLADRIDWDWLHEQASKSFGSTKGRKALPSRFMLGLLMLKAMSDLSDEALCDAWVSNPYYQYFTGEEFFAHSFPHDRSTMTLWRQTLGQNLDILIQESLRLAFETQALGAEECKAVTVDSTVMEKNVSYPTDAKLLNKALNAMRDLAVEHKLGLRQTYIFVCKRAMQQAQRYAHAKQYKRMRKEISFIFNRVGRVNRDIRRKLKDRPELKDAFASTLERASKLRYELRKKTGRSIFSWHAPEVECIGKGKAHKPYEFGVKVSVTSTNARSPGGQFVLEAAAMPGKPHDGHTLAAALERVRANTGIAPQRVFVDRGYRGHGINVATGVHVYHDGLTRLPPEMKKQLKRRPAIEPVIGHMKSDGCLGRNYLKGRTGDTVNAIMAAVGFNLRQLLNWIRRNPDLYALILRCVQRLGVKMQEIASKQLLLKTQ